MTRAHSGIPAELSHHDLSGSASASQAHFDVPSKTCSEISLSTHAAGAGRAARWIADATLSTILKGQGRMSHGRNPMCIYGVLYTLYHILDYTSYTSTKYHIRILLLLCGPLGPQDQGISIFVDR